MVDECHSAGVVGPKGRGVSELYNLYGRIDIHTGTLGKAFGGAIGGFTTGRKEIIDMLRQRSRPYLFSNSLPPAVVGAGIEVFKMLDESDELHTRLMENVTYFEQNARSRLRHQAYPIGHLCSHAVNAKLSQSFAAQMLDEGIYVTGLYYPVVPQGQARIRVQLSADFTRRKNSTLVSRHSLKSEKIWESSNKITIPHTETKVVSNVGNDLCHL